jgi:acyl-CoA dehydrogenase
LTAPGPHPRALDDDTLAAFLDAVGRFARERLIPAEAAVAEADRIPDDILDDMRAMGLYGLTIPEAYGGLGLNTEEEVRVVFELCRAAPAFRSAIGTNNGIGSQGIILAGSEAQKRTYLPRLAAGDLVASFALTEPEAGSDARALRTRADRTATGWRLNGTKRYITNAPRAGLFTVFARTESGVSAFLVPAGTPGLGVGAPDRKMGQAGSHTADVVLVDCEVPRDCLLGPEGGGFAIAMQTLDRGRIHIAAVCVALAERLIEDSLGYARDRRQFGRPIAEFQLVQAMLADSRAESHAARCMVLDAARQRDRGHAVGELASCCKLFASEMVGRVADRAVQIFGGAGYMQDYGIERLYRDVRLFRIYEGTSQIQQLVIAKAMLARSA